MDPGDIIEDAVKVESSESEVETLEEDLAEIKSNNLLDRAQNNFAFLVKKQYVDFISDFGLSERFLLDGDAMIDMLMENESLDWSHNGQFLQVIYLVEDFLSKLYQRGLRFDIFFFIDNDLFLRGLSSGKRLIRHLAIHHLLRNKIKTPEDCATLLVRGSWHDANSKARKRETLADGGGSNINLETWHTLMHKKNPAYIMTNYNKLSSLVYAVAQKCFIMSNLVNMKYLVLLDKMRMEGSRIQAHVLIPSGQPKVIAERSDLLLKMRSFCEQQLSSSKPSGTDIQDLIKRVQQHAGHKSLDRSMSSWISALVLEVLKDSSAELRALHQVLSACVTLMYTCIKISPLRCRCFALPLPVSQGFSFSKDVSAFLEKLQEVLAALFRVTAARPSMLVSSLDKRAIADMFDGRLLHAILLFSLNGLSLNDEIVSSAAKIWSAIDPEQGLSAVLGEAYKLLNESDRSIASGALQQMEERALKSQALFQREALRVHLPPPGRTCFAEVISPLYAKTLKARYESVIDADAVGSLRQDHHFHSQRLIRNEHDPFYHASKHNSEIAVERKLTTWEL
eukprot:749668-Hanusia_phi.AAC.1